MPAANEDQPDRTIYLVVEPKSITMRKELRTIMQDDQARPLTTLDINLQWQRVAFDAALALCIGVPGLNVICIPYIFVKYTWFKWHLLVRDAPGIAMFVIECVIWYNVVSGAVGDMFAYMDLFCNLRQKRMEFSVVLELVQVDVVSTACNLGAIFFCRILNVSIIEINAHVNCNKAEVEEKLLDEVQDVIKNFHEDVGELRGNHEGSAITKIDWFVIIVSTVCMLLGLLWMKLAVESKVSASLRGDAANVQFLGWQMPLAVLMSSLTSVLLTCSYWFRMTKKLMSKMSLVGRNVDELLLFTAMPTNANPELWDKTNRQSLRRLITSREGLTTSERQMANQNSLAELFAKLKFKRFDMTARDDVADWWSLRKYILVDFLEKSTTMDYCSCMSIMLLLTFITSASLDWMVHRDPWAHGFILSVILASVSVILVAKALQACIDINALLDRDASVLLDAEETILHKHSLAQDEVRDRRQTLELLQTISRKIENFDNKLQVLGITVTRNIRNGWVAAMVTLAFDALMQAVRPVVSNINIEDVEAFIQSNMTFPEFINALSIRKAE